MKDVRQNPIEISDKVLTFNNGKELEIGKILSMNTNGQVIIQLRRSRVKRYPNQIFLVKEKTSGDNNQSVETIN